MSIVVYGGKANRTHENQMLQAFLERLEDRWAASEDWIFVVANTMWNGAEIDLVCILPSAILVADFKSHSGKLAGRENGPWQADAILVKGGRKENPYQQSARQQVLSAGLAEVQVVAVGPQPRPYLRLRRVLWPHCRSTRTSAQGSLLVLPDRPGHLRNPARPGLASPELKIDQKEAREIVQRLGAQPIEWKSTRPTVHPIEFDPVQSKGVHRWPHTSGKHCRRCATSLTSDELVTFSVLGMTSTGKSCLLTEVVGEIKQVWKTNQSCCSQPPSRHAAEVEAKSIYSHLYDGQMRR